MLDTVPCDNSNEQRLPSLKYIRLMFSNRTGTSVDDGARKSINWPDQWQSDKLGTENQI